jgi:enterochelin esterase-like enzyme
MFANAFGKQIRTIVGRGCLAWLVAVLLSGCAVAGPFCRSDSGTTDINQLNRCLYGKVDDYTNNHGSDKRIYSEALKAKRDVYVYTPPGYDPEKRYPLVYWLHGFAQDEKNFLEIVPLFDRAMATGRLPKCVMVVPDGTPTGDSVRSEAGTFFLNSLLGNYEEYTVVDVWNHVVTNYSIRVEREAHVLAGVSMGGGAAYNLAIKHRNQFGAVIGIMPPLNTRYTDNRGNTHADFHPSTLRTVEVYRPNQVLASFYCGLVTVRQGKIIAPVFGEGPDVIKRIAAENPVEMLTTFDVKPGELEMFVGCGDRDEFNFDAQVDSFVYLAKKRGLDVAAVKVAGKHDRPTAFKMFEPLADWVKPRLEKYAPK